MEKRRETFLDAIKKVWVWLLVFVLLFAAALVVRLVFRQKNNNKEAFTEAVRSPLPAQTARVFQEAAGDAKIHDAVLQQTEAVADDYFADAVFCGDSLTQGWAYIDPPFQYIGMLGLSPIPGSVMTKPVYTTPEGDELLLSDAVNYLGARKIYIMLGSNGMNYTTPEILIEGYRAFLDDLIAKNPDSYIIIQSIPPVTADAAVNKWDGKYVKENVDYYNGMLKDLANEKGIYFLDTNAALSGEDGYMPDEITGGADGMHMNAEGYYRWLDYAKTHTFKGDAGIVMNEGGLLVPIRADANEEPDPGADAGEPQG